MNAARNQEFVSLLTDHQEVLRSYIIAQLPGSPDVRDILQEVNITLWERMHDFEPGTNFGAWACTTAYYKILDHRKRLKRDGRLIFDDALCERLVADSGQREPAALEMRRLALRTCLSRLSPANRELLECRYAQARGGMEELAEKTGRTRASLRVTLARLRASLRRCIHEKIRLEGGSL